MATILTGLASRVGATTVMGDAGPSTIGDRIARSGDGPLPEVL